MSMVKAIKVSPSNAGPLLILVSHAFWVLLLVAIVSTARASGYLILPVLGNQPDTGLQVGAAGFWTQTPEEHALGVNFFVLGTQKQPVQTALGIQVPVW
ncbi:MAG: hypothetical protein WED11_13730 [Natronospirillum sp.]